MTDFEIKTEIEEFYNMVKKDYIGNRFYIDDILYKNLVEHINIREMINKL